ncbi:MAG: GtrA family protein [Clostridia bacterium]|jgi:putative flippase GtrA|nr:GtrA family protein [Clostridia bacterium]
MEEISNEVDNEKQVAPAEPENLTKKQQFIQILKFTAFSISAGVIQLVSDGILCDWTGWLPWWPAYLISVILSVIWNFTFNRKFTFKAANNIPLAMGLVLVYYCAFIPVSVFGGDAIAAQLPKNLGLLVTFMMMVINFVTEFIWDKFIVFNRKVTDKIENLFKKK